MKKLLLSVSVGAFLIAPFFAFADHTTAHTISQIQQQIQALQQQLANLAQQTPPAGGGGSGGSGSGGSGGVITPPPVIDEEESDILNFNNLRIRSVSGSVFPVVIEAVRDTGISSCIKFQDKESSAGVSTPCPGIPDLGYTIRVDEDTSLLLQNRRKASITDFIIGDKINVFGFVGRSTGNVNVQALIVRNLSRSVPIPRPATPKITVLLPNGGEAYQQGAALTFGWSQNYASGNLTVRLYDYKDGKEYYSSFVSGSIGKNAGVIESLKNIPVGQYRITICDEGTPNPSVTFKPLCDSSDAPFSIVSGSTPQPSITAISPNGGESWQVGLTKTITWSSGSGNVGIYLYRWATLATDVSSGYANPVLVISANIIPASQGQFLWAIPLSLAPDQYYIRLTDSLSGDNSDAPFSVVSGPTSAGSLLVALDANSPGYQVVHSGQTNVELLRLRFNGTGEDIDLKQIAFQLSEGSYNTPNDLVGRKITLWNGATKIGEAVFPTGDTALSSLIAVGDFRIPRDSSRTLIVKGDIASITASGPLTTSGDLLKVDYDGNSPEKVGTYGIGLSSGRSFAPTSSDTLSSGVRIFRAFPKIAYIPLTAAERSLSPGTTADKVLYKISVTAVGGDVALYKLTFNPRIASGPGSITNYGVFAYVNSSRTPDTSFSSDGLVNGQHCVGAGTAFDFYPVRTGRPCGERTLYVIPSGTTRYFELRAAQVAGVDSNTVITVALEGDSAAPTYAPPLPTSDSPRGMFIMQSAAVTDGSANNDFIWSPISTTTAASPSDSDFTNGYALPGLPFVNTTPETIVGSASTQPSITVISPNGGETFIVGGQINIRWSTSNWPENTVGLSLRDANNNHVDIIGVLVPNTGNYLWSIPTGLSGGFYKVRAGCSNCTLNKAPDDSSDAPFSIVVGAGSPHVRVSAGLQPSATLAPKTAVVPFTNITVSPETRVFFGQMIVERSGSAPDMAFKEIILIANTSSGIDARNENRIVAYGTLDPVTHRAILKPRAGFGAFSGPANLTVAGVMADDLSRYAGTVGYLSVVSINFTVQQGGSPANVAAPLPIKGTGQTLNDSLVIGSLSISGISPYTPFSSLTLTASAVENVRLNKIVLHNVGGSVTVNGARYECSVLDTDFDTDLEACNFPGGGILIQKNSSVSLTPARASATLTDGRELTVYGQTYGYRIMPGITGGGGGTGLPDLVVNALSITPVEPAAGQEATLRGEVTNVGKIQAENIHFTADFGFPSAQRALADDTCKGGTALAPNRSCTISVGITYNAPAQQNSVVVTADPGNQIQESDETNNSRRITFNIVATETRWSGDNTFEDSTKTSEFTLSSRRGATYGLGKSGQGFLLDGFSGYLEVADNSFFRPAGAVSVAAWVRMTVAQANAAIIKKTGSPDAGFALEMDSSGTKPCFYVYAGGGWKGVCSSSSLPVYSSVFYHVAGTYDGKTVAVWVNGVPASAPASGTLGYGDGSFNIGRDQVYGRYFSGTIDEVEFWQKGLSESEVKSLAAVSSLNQPALASILSSIGEALAGISEQVKKLSR